MNYLYDLFTNFYLVSAVCGWLVAQLIKTFTGFFKLQEFSVRTLLFGTGGMPSSHTAAACGLAVACALKDGFGSSHFAMGALLAMVIMIDAIGVRRETGKQSRALNLIVDEMFSSEHAGTLDMQFKELIGHTPLQVFFGAVTGIVTACLLYLIPVFSGAA